MMSQSLILAGIGTGLMTIAMIFVSLLLIGLILLQKNRGSGLSGAFGGVGGHTAFGTKTGDFLTWVTVGLVTVFLLLAVGLNFAFEPESSAAEAAATTEQTTEGTTGGPADGGTPAEETPPVMPDNPAG